MHYSCKSARRLLVACVAASALGFAGAPALSAPIAAATSATQTYDLKAQSLESAIQAIALRSGRTILAPSPLVAGKRAPALKGDYTAAEAVRALLSGSGLEVVETNGALVVREAPGARGESDEASAPASTVAEVMVTGSRLRGGAQAAPIDTITRSDIEKTGFAEVGDVVRSLPEDWTGGQSPGVQPGAGLSSQANQDTTGASTVDLRGLGTDATLVLVDGQRLSAEGEFGAADISAIPLSAIQRIDVVTDGASALYGSDAVAGVANFVLRKDFSGEEFSETLGGATEGGGLLQDYDGLVGRSWSSGHLLASVESVHQGGITTGQRDFTSTAAPVNGLLDTQNRVSLFTNAGQDLTAWASFHMEGIFSERVSGDHFESQPGAPIYRYANRIQSYFVSPGLTFALPGAWTASLDGVASASRDSIPLFYTGGANYSTVANHSNSVELSANGDFIRLPGGVVKLAFGGGYLDQGYDYTQSHAQPQAASRRVAYIFGEASVPLVAPNPARLGLNALDLTLAGRVEHYSDFGSTSNPKVGLRYEPLSGLALRATWGTSFKAPEFSQEALPLYAYLYSAAAMGGGSGASLLAYGGNAQLKPERATSWTAGLDWSPPQDPGLKASLTYFNIDYKDRVVQPVADPLVALSDPLYAPFVTLSPTPAQVAGVVNSATGFFNLSGMSYNPAQVAALVEDHFVNATSQTIHGVDLSIKQSFPLPMGTLETSAAATWLHIGQRLIPGSPEQTLTGTLFNPPTLRFRGGLTWVYGGFSATGALNYIASETDTNVTPNVPISAFTTVDYVMSYRMGRLGPALPGLVGSLSITNLFDRAPPFAGGAGFETHGVYFDSTNASAMGRFVSLTLRQKF